jgi:hypothetical protein
MNNTYLSLSSSITSKTDKLPLLVLNDMTTLNVILTGVSENFLPCFLKINWGDDVEEFFENDVVFNISSPTNRFSEVLNTTYSHIYYPSGSSTSRDLSANFYVSYCNGDMTTFTVPISVINYNHTQSIEDLTLINTISKFDKKIHQFVTKNGGYLIELETPFN